MQPFAVILTRLNQESIKDGFIRVHPEIAQPNTDGDSRTFVRRPN